MPTAIECSSCGQRLRVSDHAFGKLKRCPKCGALLPTSLADAPLAALLASNQVGRESEEAVNAGLGKLAQAADLANDHLLGIRRSSRNLELIALIYLVYVPLATALLVAVALLLTMIFGGTETP